MKKFLLITVLTLPLFTVAQEYQYVPFPDSGAIWSEVFYPAYDEGETIQKIYERFAVTGEDTLMNEMLYKKLYIFYDSVFNKNNATCIGGIREDSLKKVYYKGERIHMFKPLDNEIILYDFSLEIGDTIWLWDMYNVFDWLIVEYIDTIQIGNTLRKKFLFNFWRSKWIEGIGCLSGLLFAGRDDITGLGDFEDNELICFFQNDTLLYHNYRFHDCFPKLSNSKDIHTKTALTAYPNPAKGNTILFEWGNDKIETIEIFSINGKPIANMNVNDQCRLEYSTSKLQTGVYFYKATTSDKIFQTGKFVVP
ncbi:MAG: T9SS type A sorting domain-containing protein [Prolixibacteraceae bacterium]|nr:T9SS type A sorting domain-containing protein [Prolixibacteraceae bacterium]